MNEEQKQRLLAETRETANKFICNNTKQNLSRFDV